MITAPSRYIITAIALDWQSKTDARQRQNRRGHLVQRFGSALNLNIHFHMLFLDGVSLTAQGGVWVIGA